MLPSIKGTVEAIIANRLETVRVVIAEGLLTDVRLGYMNSTTAEAGAVEERNGENRTR